MTESWQTPEAAARAAEKRKKLDEWKAKVEAERQAIEREEAEVARLEAANPSGDAKILDLSMAPSVRRGLTLSDVDWNWSDWTEEKCEETLLGWIYRQRHSEGDRRGDSSGLLVDAAVTGNRTGIPDSEAKLAPRGTRKSGVQTLLETTISPRKFAAICILRDRDFASEADGTAGANLWAIKEDALPWREDEELVHGELSYRFKKLFLKWSARGLLKLEPAMKWSEKDSSGLGRDGMPDQCTLTHQAVELAEERIEPGSALARGPGNPMGTKTQRQRDEVREKAGWYFREWMDGRKAGT